MVDKTLLDSALIKWEGVKMPFATPRAYRDCGVGIRGTSTGGSPSTAMATLRFGTVNNWAGMGVLLPKTTKNKPSLMLKVWLSVQFVFSCVSEKSILICPVTGLPSASSNLPWKGILPSVWAYNEVMLVKTPKSKLNNK